MSPGVGGTRGLRAPTGQSIIRGSDAATRHTLRTTETNETERKTDPTLWQRGRAQRVAVQGPCVPKRKEMSHSAGGGGGLGQTCA